MAKRYEREKQTVAPGEVGSADTVLTESPEEVPSSPEPAPAPPKEKPAAPTVAPIVVEKEKTPPPPPPAPVRVGPACPSCGSNAVGVAGGMRHCNQCGISF